MNCQNIFSGKKNKKKQRNIISLSPAEFAKGLVRFKG